MGGDGKSGCMTEELGSGCSVRVERLVRPDEEHFQEGEWLFGLEQCNRWPSLQ
jgi:hypothetical protein